MQKKSHTFTQAHTKRARGFTLIEVLIALVIFALGMLGISLYSGNALRVASTNAARAQALNDASQVMSAFYAAANGGAGTFKAALDAFDDGGNVAYDNAQTLAGTNVLVQISAAQDVAGNDLFTTASIGWVSPITLGVKVVFEGGDDAIVADDKSAITSYTFLVPLP